jgi:choline monooxygenase
VASWESFIFVNLNQEGPGLGSYLSELWERISVAGLKFFARQSYTLACNWKVYVDNYLDGGYHVPHLHKALNSVLDYSEYTIENGSNYVLQSSPMVASQDASVAQTRIGSRADYYWIYPNFMINLYEGVIDTNLVLPLGQEKCLVVFDFFFGDASAEYKAESVTVSDRVQAEDVEICESVQRGLHSRAYGAGRLSVRREGGEHLFHRLLARDLKRVD